MDILALTLDELGAFFTAEFGKGMFHASALYREIYKAGNRDILNIPEFAASPAFAEKLEKRLILAPGQVLSTFREKNLVKFITGLSDGLKIESVLIPMAGRNTLCVSSQAGCRMGCRFCETGRAGLKRNLSVSEIVGQVFNARFVLGEKIRNIVFMGMGEPFDNFDPVIAAIRIMTEQKGFDIALRHITVSTAGLVRGIDALGRLNMKGLRLAVSVNSADDATRSFLMPVNRAHSLQTLKTALQNFPLTRRGCFLFEYILIKGLNDSETDAIKLAEYIHPLPVRLNLIPLNAVAGFNYESPCDDDMQNFAESLAGQGVFVVKRWSKGRSVSAGCGQLGLEC
nr:23S rRNA (adenine(2503)-C(2))-methyltransferase RlmN [Desulfobacula sp.]